MRIGSAIFVLVATVAWGVLLYITIRATGMMGVAAVMDTFNGDFSHPWRAQFNTDLLIYLLLGAGWMIWRTRSRRQGILMAFLTVMLGSLFILPVLVLATIRTGSIKAALLGRHSQIN